MEFIESIEWNYFHFLNCMYCLSRLLLLILFNGINNTITNSITNTIANSTTNIITNNLPIRLLNKYYYYYC